MTRKTVLCLLVLPVFLISCGNNEAADKKAFWETSKAMVKKALETHLCLVKKAGDIPKADQEASLNFYKLFDDKHIDKILQIRETNLRENCSNQDAAKNLAYAKCLTERCESLAPGFNYLEKLGQLEAECKIEGISQKCNNFLRAFSSKQN